MLYEYLRPFYPAFDSPKLKKEEVFQKLYPEEKYLDTRIRTLISLLKRLAEDYLVELELNKENGRKSEILADALSSRELYPLFTGQVSAMIERLEGQSQRDMNYYHAKMLWHQALFFHPQTAKYSLESEHLRETMYNLDQFYLQAKLRFSLEVANRKKFLAEEFDNLMLNELLEKVKSSSLQQANPVIRLYYNILQLHEHGRNDALLNEVKIAFDQNHQLLSTEQGRVILTNLINHTIQVYNTGVQEYLQHQFELYKIGLERGLVVHNDRISEAAFTNISVIGSILKKFKWVKSFIQDYVQYLDPAICEQAQNLSEAYLYYHQADYDATISKLMAVPFLEVTYGFRARGLLLRTYYECILQDDNYFELILAHLESFRKYLKRNPTISKQRETAYYNLINLTQKLIIIQVEKFSDKALLKQLRTEVKMTSPIMTKAWLLEKINNSLV